MDNKAKYITPIVMLFVVALSAIIMTLEDYEMIPMLKTLLVVSIVFYFIGDIARYVYTCVRPKVISQDYLQAMAKMSLDNCFELAKDDVFESANFKYVEAQNDSEKSIDDEYDISVDDNQNLSIDEEGYSDEELSSDFYEGYTDENQ